MLRYDECNIVFKELPGYTSLAISITGCKNSCEGCHSPKLMGDTGEELTKDKYEEILNKYEKYVDVVLFLGYNEKLKEIIDFSKDKYSDTLICVYTGDDNPPDLKNIDFVKVGRYKKELGGLDSIKTNQRMYSVIGGLIEEDITNIFK